MERHFALPRCSNTPPLRFALRTRSPCSVVRIANSASGPRPGHPCKHSRNGHSGKCGPRWASAGSAAGEVRSRCPHRPERPAGLPRKSGSNPRWTCSIFSLRARLGTCRRGARRRHRDGVPSENHPAPAQLRRRLKDGFGWITAHRFESCGPCLVQSVLVRRR